MNIDYEKLKLIYERLIGNNKILTEMNKKLEKLEKQESNLNKEEMNYQNKIQELNEIKESLQNYPTLMDGVNKKMTWIYIILTIILNICLFGFDFAVVIDWLILLIYVVLLFGLTLIDLPYKDIAISKTWKEEDVDSLLDLTESKLHKLQIKKNDIITQIEDLADEIEMLKDQISADEDFLKANNKFSKEMQVEEEINNVLNEPNNTKGIKLERRKDKNYGRKNI